MPRTNKDDFSFLRRDSRPSWVSVSNRNSVNINKWSTTSLAVQSCKKYSIFRLLLYQWVFSGSFGSQLCKSSTFFHRKLMETSMKMEWQRKPFRFLLLPNLCEFDLWRGIRSFVYGWNSTVAKVMSWFLLVTRTCVLHKHIPSNTASREKWINRVEIKFGKSSKSNITMSVHNDFVMP